MKSLGAVLDESRGLGQGFDFLRLALALAVASAHAIQIATGSNAMPLWLEGPINGILPMFFALSGFLITASALRLSLGNFLVNRGLRIFPALCVEVLLSAFVLGPIFTALPLSAYFTDIKFFYYLTNLVGTAYLRLPGVFGGAYVNGSIWTVPFEIGCYGIISVLIYFGLIRRGRLMTGVFVGLLAAQTAIAALGVRADPGLPHTIAEYAAIAPQRLFMSVFQDRSGLIGAFLGGLAIYLLRYRIPYSRALFLACAVAIVLIGPVASRFPQIQALYFVYNVVPFVYAIVFLGLTRLPLPQFLHKGDYSYGIYLYGYPISMAIREIFPGEGANWAFLLGMSWLLISLFAAFSWHCIERPILQLRKKFSFVARQRLEEPADPAPAEPRGAANPA
jgi:peptidoglycan/LPS O-acetylase OafA/YrhL